MDAQADLSLLDAHNVLQLLLCCGSDAVHTGERPYKCGAYWNTYTSTSALGDDRKNKHKLKHFKNATLDSTPISSRTGLYSKQKSKRFGLRLPWRRKNSRVTQNLKVTELQKVTLWAKNVLQPLCIFNSQSKDKIKSGSKRPLAMLELSVWHH